MNMLIRSLTYLTLMASLPSVYAAAVGAAVDTILTHTAPCFTQGMNVNCEVSGVARIGDKFVLANDKQMPGPGDPAIFTLLVDKHKITGIPTYVRSAVLRSADKYEGLTTTLDGKYVVAITAFNKEGTAESPAADALNTLLYWPVDRPDAARIVMASTRGQVSSSRGLRQLLSQAVGAPYYQIEALSTAPGDRLLVGVRKYGQSSKAADFSFLLLSIPFSISEQGATLGGAFEVVWKLTPDQLATALGSNARRPELGLSGLEFDRHNRDRFYAVTSFETDDGIGGYLWVLPFDGRTIGEPQPVKLKNGLALTFIHKPEGVEVLDENHVLVVHDDDRVRVREPENGTVREEHEFAYSVIGFAAQ